MNNSTAEGGKFALPTWRRSLSMRLLVLTVAFVMLAEVFVYAPSIGRARLVYLQERLEAAHLAILSLEASPDFMVSRELEVELMGHVGAHLVSLSKPDSGRLVLMARKPERLDATFDLDQGKFFGLIRDAVVTLLSRENRILRILGTSPKDPQVMVEVVMDEAPLRDVLLGYSWRILSLSLLISVFTASLVYLSLHWMMVRPMRRITQSMTAFRQNPEDVAHSLASAGRSDEIGIAQRELVTMQEGLRAALLQKTRLAALGVAVTKINHDLRNLLSTASLVSDSLSGSEDPKVRRLAPRLVTAIDRAISLCSHTLNFTREGPPTLDLSSFDLKGLVDEVLEALPEPEGEQRQITIGLTADRDVEADREQLYRVFDNLISNAVQAGASKIAVREGEVNGRIVIDVEDDGPGLPPRARESIFQPFTSSARQGGTGLGLAIARDLMRAHGGDIVLLRSTSDGTVFRLELPLEGGGVGGR